MHLVLKTFCLTLCMCTCAQETGAKWEHAALGPILHTVQENLRLEIVQIDTLVPLQMAPCSPEVFKVVRRRALNLALYETQEVA